jgi:hypothetical protein
LIELDGKHQRALRLADAGQRADSVEHAVDLFGGLAFDERHQVERAADRQHASHLRDRLQRLDHGFAFLRVDGQQHVHAQHSRGHRRVEPHRVAGDDALCLEAPDPADDGGAGDAQRAGERGHRHPGVFAEQRKELAILVVHLRILSLWHVN